MVITMPSSSLRQAVKSLKSLSNKDLEKSLQIPEQTSAQLNDHELHNLKRAFTATKEKEMPLSWS